jgi:hypothetical protein
VRTQHIEYSSPVPRSFTLSGKSTPDIASIIRTLGAALRRELEGRTVSDPHASPTDKDRGIAAEYALAATVLSTHPQPCACRGCALAQALHAACVYRAQGTGKAFDEAGADSDVHPVRVLARDLCQVRHGRPVADLAERLRAYADERSSLESAGARAIPAYAALTERIRQAAAVLAESRPLPDDDEPLDEALLRGFASPELRERFGKKPHTHFVAQLTGYLAGGGFSRREIAELLDDGLGGTMELRIDRVKKRLRPARN